MSKKTKIQELVDFALSDTSNLHKEIVIDKVNEKQAKIMLDEIGINLENAERCIDTSTIRHIIKNHGSVKKEEKRGQIAINLDDFDLITKVLETAKDVKYRGKNNLKQDVFEYRKKINHTYVVLEAVIVNKRRGNRMSISTMYKIKGS
jgi:hypothetical protein